MKCTKIIPHIVLFCCLVLLVSCNQKQQKTTSTIELNNDVSFYIKKMKDSTLSDSSCLAYANKALAISKQTANKKITKEILQHKLKLFSNLNITDSLITISKDLLKISLIEKDSVSSSKNYYLLGYYYSINNKKDSAFINYKLSNVYFLKLGDSSNIGESFIQMAIIQSDFGDFYGSDKSAVHALKYLKETDTSNLTAVYNCIAITAKKQNDFKEAIYWYDKALAITSNKIDRIKYLNNKANSYRLLEKYDTSIAILTNLLADTLVNSIPKTKARILDNLAFNKWSANNNEEVSNHLIEALSIRLKENDVYGQIASYAHLSEVFYSKNPKLALSYALKMYNAALIQKSPQDQLEALQKIIDLNDNGKTKKYYQHYVKLNDSLNLAERTTLNKFVKLQFDSDNIREENLTLKINDQKKEIIVQKEKTMNIILIGLGIITSLGFLFFIKTKREKYLKEKRQEVYYTEKRLSKKIHDEVANNVVNIMNKIQYTNNSKEELLDDLDKVYFLTRNISHENSTIETGEKFEHFLKDLLTSFNNSNRTIVLKDIHITDLHTIAAHKQIEIYRILQELMVNMQKHSHATLVAIVFKKDKNIFKINYSDNGVGIDLNVKKFKNGLQNVETRIKSINGNITFETSINNGFKAFLSF